MRRASAAWFAAACALGLGACSPSAEVGPSPRPQPSVSPSPSPAAQVAEQHLPPGPATVIDGPDAITRALASSQTFYASAPVVVVAPVDDVAAQVRAAGIAVALGAPLLLGAANAPGTAPVAADPVAAEIDRLDAAAVLAVGRVTTDPDGPPVAVAPEDDDALEAMLGVDVSPVPLPAPGTELAAVLALDRAAPTLPSADPAAAVLSGSASPSPASSPAPSSPASPSPASPSPASPSPASPSPASPSPASPSPASPSPASPSPASPSPLATPSPSAAPRQALPATALADALVGGLLLTTGDPADLAAVATARAAGVAVAVVPTGDPRATSATVQALAAAAATSVVGLGAAFGDTDTLAWRSATAATGVQLPGGGQLALAGHRYVAMYGTPSMPALGILGEQDLPSSIARAQGLAAAYQALSPDVVVPAFEMIASVASAGPGPDGNYSNELPPDSFVPWVEAAAAAGVYVVIDLQPGRTDFLTQAQSYESLLRYPNVGLALDPEWRLASDQVHLRQIGSVGVDEVNAVAAYLAQLTRANALPQKLFVLHQFKQSMIQERERLDMTHPELAVVLHVDGQGGQGAKTGTWNALHDGAPAGVAWGWKNFIDEDVPMLTPEQTYAIAPPPELVSYQ